MNSLLTTLPALLPVAYAFAEEHEAIILEKGEPLNEEQMVDARRARVHFPEKIRVLRVEALPESKNTEAMFLAREMRLMLPESNGLTLGYGIYLPRKGWHDRMALVHECVHVGQCERLGGLRPFIDLYIRECVEPGFPFGSLEQEGIVVSRDICKVNTGSPV